MRASVIRPRFPRPSSGQRESEKSAARRDSHVLFPVNGEGHRRRIDRGAALEVPEGLARRGVQGDKVSFRVAGEDQPPCRGKHAAPESSQKVLLVRKLCVDRFRKIDILFIHFEFSLACPLETRIKRHTRRPSPCVSVYLRFSPWRFRCLVPSVGQVRAPMTLLRVWCHARTRSVRPTPPAPTNSSTTAVLPFNSLRY